MFHLFLDVVHGMVSSSLPMSFEKIAPKEEDLLLLKTLKVALEVLAFLGVYIVETLRGCIFSSNTKIENSKSSPPSISTAVSQAPVEEQLNSAQDVLNALKEALKELSFNDFVDPNEAPNEKQTNKDVFTRAFPAFLNETLVWHFTQLPLTTDFPHLLFQQAGFAPFIAQCNRALSPSDKTFSINIPTTIDSSENVPSGVQNPQIEAIALWFLRLSEEKLSSYLKFLEEKFRGQGGDPEDFFTKEALQTLEATKAVKSPCEACEACFPPSYNKDKAPCKNPVQTLSLSFWDTLKDFLLSYFIESQKPYFPSSKKELSDLLYILASLKRFFPEKISSYFKEQLDYIPTRMIELTWKQEEQKATLSGYLLIREVGSALEDTRIRFQINLDFMERTCESTVHLL